MGDYDDDMPSLRAADQQDPEPASAGSPPQPADPPDLMSEVMDGAGSTAPALAKIVARYGLREDDPAWLIAVAVRDATAAGTVADQAAGRIEAATQAVGDLVFRQAQRAGADIAATAATAIEAKTLEAGQAIVTVIQHAAGAGGAALKAAAASLPTAAAAQRDGILAEWRSSLAATAAQEAAHRARRGEWWLMAAIAVTMAAMAGLGGWVGRATAPQAWPVGAPPAAMWRFPKRDLNEYAWPATTARVAQRCVAGDVCLELRRR
ncbi:MAG: hypothetical protein ACYCXX_13540 [Acidiferrobacter thiooxydans]